MRLRKTYRCPHCDKELPPRPMLPTSRSRPPPRERNDPWLPLVGKWLLEAQPKLTTASDAVLAIGVPRTMRNLQRAGCILVDLGWKRVQRREKNGRRRWIYVAEKPASVPLPPHAPFEPVQRKTAKDPFTEAMVTDVGRWLLDVGDSPVALDEVMAGLGIPFTHGHRIKVGLILVRHMGRVRVRRLEQGHMKVTYDRPRKK